MRGGDTFTEGLFTLKKLDDFVPTNHPLRVIRTMVNKALAEMGELFARMYEDEVKGGRPSVAPEKLLRAMLLQVLYSIRSERQLMEQTQYNLLFRWFIGLSMDDAVWVPTVFSKNRERLIEHDAVPFAWTPHWISPPSTASNAPSHNTSRTTHRRSMCC
jgi:transposase